MRDLYMRSGLKNLEFKVPEDTSLEWFNLECVGIFMSQSRPDATERTLPFFFFTGKSLRIVRRYSHIALPSAAIVHIYTHGTIKTQKKRNRSLMRCLAQSLTVVGVPKCIPLFFSFEVQ